VRLQILKFRKEIGEAAMVVVDGNISVEAMRALVTTCAESDTEGTRLSSLPSPLRGQRLILWTLRSTLVRFSVV
jgi:hypothetical protein